jgi:hypothetical protein
MGISVASAKWTSAVRDVGCAVSTGKASRAPLARSQRRATAAGVGCGRRRAARHLPLWEATVSFLVDTGALIYYAPVRAVTPGEEPSGKLRKPALGRPPHRSLMTPMPLDAPSLVR